MKKKIDEITSQAENLYSVINHWVGDDKSLDYIYPNHDGQADHNAAADLEMMRQALYSLKRVCEVGIEHLTLALDVYNENEEQ